MSKKRELKFSAEPWSFKVPFSITGHTFSDVDLLLVSVGENGITGRGEAAGVYYLGDDGARMVADVARVSADIEAGADRHALRSLLPPGGARNAIDCALWDLEAKQNGFTIWDLVGIEPAATRSVMTIGIDTPEAMGVMARSLDTSLIKVKLDGDRPLERIRAVRDARPDADIVVDINQGWSFEQLVEYAPAFATLGIAMIEQPLPRGGDEMLEGYRSPIPLCADESCLCVAEFEQAARRYQMINIKLDKCGGLTEALELVNLAQRHGIELMVGNMVGTSLAMAPGFVVAQFCRFVDLDGPLFLTGDRDNPMSYRAGVVSAPDRRLWG